MGDLNVLSEDERKSLAPIRKLLDLPHPSLAYRPSNALAGCVICGGSIPWTSPDGVTCGETACRDGLPDKFRELRALEGLVGRAEAIFAGLFSGVVTPLAVENWLRDWEDIAKGSEKDSKAKEASSLDSAPASANGESHP